MQYHHIGLVPAIQMLKAYAGIKDDGEEVVTRLEASRIARKYRHTAKTHRESRAEILPPDYMERYEFRKDKLRFWEQEGISMEVMRDFGVRYDSFDNRIVYPVKNYQGDIISVCGRTCDPKFKEKGIRKYTYFQSLGNIDTLFGYFDNKTHILSHKEIILFEGAKSVLKAYGWGIKNTAAILTSHLSENQFRFLVQLSSWHHVRIVFALDSEIDVTKDKNIMRLAKYANVEWLKNFDGLLNEKDSPVDQGQEVFMKLYEGRMRIT